MTPVPLCPTCTSLATAGGLARLPTRCQDCDALVPGPGCPVRASEAPGRDGRTPWGPERPQGPWTGTRSPDSRVRVWTAPVAPAEASPAPRSPLDLAGRLARVAEDPELVRVRTLLAELRPDAPDPLEPPPVERPGPPALVVVRDGTPPWDRLPAGLGGAWREVVLLRDPGELASEVLRRLATLPPDARAVLRWLRAHARLVAGLRGLYVDCGMAFAGAEQQGLWGQDLGARRDGAAPYGRRLVLRSAVVWSTPGLDIARGCAAP